MHFAANYVLRAEYSVLEDDVQLHARRELRRICSRLSDDDWDLLTGAAAGFQYDGLAVSHASALTALLSRVCRLRRALMARRNAGNGATHDLA